LTQGGHRQAESIVSRLLELDIAAVYASPMVRAQSTVAPFCARSGLSLRVETGLEEREISWPPPASKAIVEAGWADLDFKVSGFESNREAQDRFMGALGAITARHEGERVLVCAHGNVIALALHRVLGSIEAEDRQIEYCGVRHLRVAGESWHYEAAFGVLGESAANLPSGT
jgi:broad specificity phosphatase PhoE